MTTRTTALAVVIAACLAAGPAFAQATEVGRQNIHRGTITDIVDLTRFIVATGEHQDAINRVMARRLGDHRPASTSVEVVRLATDPRLVLELRAVAVVPD